MVWHSECHDDDGPLWQFSTQLLSIQSSFFFSSLGSSFHLHHHHFHNVIDRNRVLDPHVASSSVIYAVDPRIKSQSSESSYYQEA